MQRKKSILCSDCNIQNDAFAASAIQWASETFGFAMPPIKIYEKCKVY